MASLPISVNTIAQGLDQGQPQGPKRPRGPFDAGPFAALQRRLNMRKADQWPRQAAPAIGGLSSMLISGYAPKSAVPQQLPQPQYVAPGSGYAARGGIAPQFASGVASAAQQIVPTDTYKNVNPQFSQAGLAQPIAPAPVAPTMSYEDAKSKFGAQRARQMQAAGQVSG